MTLAINNYQTRTKLKEESHLATDQLLAGSIFIRDKGYLRKITISDINWIRGDGGYTHLSVKEVVYTLRNNLKEIMKKLPEALFFKISKAYVVNLANIEAISSKEVIVGGKVIPVGRNFYPGIIARIKLINP